MIEMEKTRSIGELLRFIEKNYHKDQAFAEKDSHGWVYMSHQEFLSQVKAMTLYLNSIGIQKGDLVGILALSGIRWLIVDLAIMACGGITVPLFPNISKENFLFECQQTNLKTLFVLGPKEWRMYQKHRERFERVIAMDEAPLEENGVPYISAIEIGHALLQNHPHLFDEIIDQIDENDLATIVYTSSSNGIPKGVLLSHKNILALGFHKQLEFNESDRFLSFLPLAHIYCRITTFYLLRWNVTLYFLNDIKQLMTACQEIKPTASSFVPRILEKAYAHMVAKVNEAGFLKRSIGHWAFNIALDPNFEHHFFHPLADQMVYKQLREIFGGHLRIVLTGSAPLNPALNHFFNHIGIPIYEGYGMTEMMVISLNTPKSSKIGTVGMPCEDVEVRISEEGEILVRADGVMQGYYKNPEATAIALDKAGWLHTGDKGSIDNEGYVTIAGRIQDIVKSSKGEWIALAILEQELNQVPFVEYSMVVAENRKFVSVLIFPNFEVVHALKKSQNLLFMTDEEYLNSEYIKGEMNTLIETINAHHNDCEQIRAYRFVLDNLSIETGELTPTLKIRRKFVAEKYKSLIDSMYPKIKENLV